MLAPEQSTLQIAIDYVRRGWAPLRIPLRAKAPTFKNWPSFRITEAEAPQHFDRACNIGVILGQASGGLTDVDLDCPEAIDLAPEILSPTPAVFGRKSKPESHWLYRVEGESPTEKLTDPLTGETLVELRGNGGLQTVFPGSVHPSGELIEWFNDEAFNNETPRIIETDRLRKEVRELAAYSLITRYYKGAEDVTDDKCLEEALKTLDHRVVERIQIWLGLQPSANGSLSAHHNDSTHIFGPSNFGSPPAHLAGLQTKSFNLDHLNPKFLADPILAGCAQMQRLRDNAANQNRDSWWHCLGTLAFCEGGDRIAHQLSSAHPKYSLEETQRELDGWRTKAGASLCETFDRKIPGICGRCPHQGKIKSPIILGISQPTITQPSTNGAASPALSQTSDRRWRA